MDTSPPLTAPIKSAGYQRRPEVVDELEAIDGLPIAEWVDRAYLWKVETLCTLARRALCRGRYDLFSDLVDGHVYPRAMRIAHAKCRGLSDIDTQEVVEKALNAINEDLIHADLESLRYCEISFGQFVSRRALTAAGRLRKRRAREVPLDNDPDDVPVNGAQTMMAMKRALELSDNLRMALEKVLSKLSDEQRIAFEYWFHCDYPIESKDPYQTSIASIVNKDKRTVHYWLQRVFKALRAEIGERS